MLCHGGLIRFKSPVLIVGGSESETEKSFKERETRSCCCRQVPRCQLFESKFDKSKSEPVLKQKTLDANSTFNGKSLVGEEIKFKPPEKSRASNSHYRQDALSKKSTKMFFSDASCNEDVLGPSGSDRFSEKSSSYARDSNDEDWRRLSRALASGPTGSVISNHDLMRIAELRFSTDMKKGDSGSQVVLLQKALFWLGHLSKESDITGYFGMETKKALREFQEAHGVGQTGLWGPLSKQALWHIVSAKILHRAVDEKSSKLADVQDCGLRSKLDVFRQVCQSWTPMKLADAFKTTMPEGDLRLLSGIAFLVVGILLGIFITKISFPSPQSNPMKRRIVRSTELEKHNPDSRDEKDVNTTPRSNGTTTVNNMSQVTRRMPAYETDLNATSQADALGVHEKKVFPGSMYVSSLGHGVQNGAYGGSKKDAYAPPVPIRKVSSSKLATESTRGKQPEQWSKPSGQPVSVSRVREGNKPLSRTPEIARFRKEDIESPFSASMETFAGRKDELSGSSERFNNDFRLANDDEPPGAMQGEEELSVRKRIEELRKAIEAAEQNGQAAVLALAEERKRSRDLEEKIRRQRESAAALEGEVRVLKESHDALLESLQKNIGSATRGASLLYRNFKNDGSSGLS